MKCLLRRRENQRGIGGERYAPCMCVLVEEQVGSEVAVTWVVGQVDQHCKALDAEIRVGLQPEPARIETILKTNVRIGQIRAKQVLNQARGVAALKDVGDIAEPVIGIKPGAGKVGAAVIMNLAGARHAAERRWRQGKLLEMRLHAAFEKIVCDPVRKGGFKLSGTLQSAKDVICGRVSYFWGEHGGRAFWSTAMSSRVRALRHPTDVRRDQVGQVPICILQT